MGNRIEKTKSKRFLAFVFDIAFIMLVAFVLYMLFGLIFKIDSECYQIFIFYPLLVIMISYTFFGELIFRNTLGKYLFGIEIAALIALVFSLQISMGFAVKKTDFYNTAINDFKTKGEVKITGLTRVVNQSRNAVNFIVPVSDENRDKYAIIYLERAGKEWKVIHTDFSKEHIIGFSYGFTTSSSRL